MLGRLVDLIASRLVVRTGGVREWADEVWIGFLEFWVDG